MLRAPGTRLLGRLYEVNICPKAEGSQVIDMSESEPALGRRFETLGPNPTMSRVTRKPCPAAAATAPSSSRSGRRARD